MTYQPVLNDFWEQVQKSIDNRSFAKLTLAKTIGDTDLKNIYVRPVLQDDQLLMSMIKRYKTEEIETFLPMADCFIYLNDYVNNPFLTVLLFTTQENLTFKLNKKRVGTTISQAPTFKNASDVMLQLLG
jgi:hypothetical protein